MLLYFFFISVLLASPLLIGLGLIAATVNCCLQGWSKSLFWRTFLTGNMVGAWLPLAYLIFADGPTIHGGQGLIFAYPFTIIIGIGWYFLNSWLLKRVKASVVRR